MNYQNLFNGAMFIIVVVGATATALNSRSQKKSNDETDALTTIKIKDLTIETLQKENKEMTERFSKQGERIAVLENENKRLMALVENRNPELESFIKTAEASLKSILDTNAIILQSIEKLLKT